MWNTFNKAHELYQFIQKVTAARTKTKWYNEGQIQRFSDASFYGFTTIILTLMDKKFAIYSIYQVIAKLFKIVNSLFI